MDVIKSNKRQAKTSFKDFISFHILWLSVRHLKIILSFFVCFEKIDFIFSKWVRIMSIRSHRKVSLRNLETLFGIPKRKHLCHEHQHHGLR